MRSSKRIPATRLVAAVGTRGISEATRRTVAPCVVRNLGSRVFSFHRAAPRRIGHSQPWGRAGGTQPVLVERVDSTSRWLQVAGQVQTRSRMSRTLAWTSTPQPTWHKAQRDEQRKATVSYLRRDRPTKTAAVSVISLAVVSWSKTRVDS